MTNDPLDSDVVRRSLKLIGRQRVTDLCPRCLAGRMPAGADLCASCVDEIDRHERAKKRTWWRGTQRPPQPVTATEAAEGWLKAQLRRGPQSATDLRERAAAAGIAPTTLHRAADRVGVVKAVSGRGQSRSSTWTIPARADHTDGA